ncbi:DUF2797 domain-containing protein [Phytohalomonas tamaricis]|uniref:DUF2797 domain-containing protein n=1 Tax=Phytohalomonas tamaricis TaxID=2081032 RepID=UPI000D0BD1A4|nr:DUF2797 domain-containing protein [Phytohalomonas tamaricis]
MALEATAPVSYTLRLGTERIALNPYLDRVIHLNFTGRILCVNCGRKTNKSFSQGYCYPCFKKLAQCDTCIMRPEICHFAQGTCREPEWGERHCFQPHVVYLANSSGLKVGITKPSQLPTRWLDQGAIQALPIFEVDSRQQSGMVEALLREKISDRTQWQRMLKGQNAPVDLLAERDDLLRYFEPGLAQLREQFGAQSIREIRDQDVLELDYPVLAYPTKVVSLNFDKQSRVGGRLMGMKGQYLIFDSGVINLRKFGGYEVMFEAA